MRSIRLALIVAASLFLIGCTTASEISSNTENAAPAEQSQSYRAANEATASSDAVDTADDAEPEAAADKTAAADLPPVPPVRRKIIRNAELSLEAADPSEVQRKITSIAESRDGFVVNSEQRSAGELIGEKQNVAMTLRVPSDAFDDVLVEIRKTASRVVREQVKGEDVTDQFVDLESRLRAKKALEEQVLGIMKRATTVEEALRVQQDLSAVQEEIERIRGRMRLLENQSALSTIMVNIGTPAAVAGGASGFFHELRQVFSDGIENALGFLLIFLRVLLTLAPFLLIIVLPLLVLLRYTYRRFRAAGSGEADGQESMPAEE